MPLPQKISPTQATYSLVILMALLHLMVAGSIDLSVDEAHYALYGLFPDWSYFDHPPMVGWLQALIVPFSQHELALRLWPVVLSAMAGLVLYRLSAELFAEESHWLGFVAVLLLQSAVIFQLLAIALVPELPLLLFALAALLFLARALEQDRLRDWLLLGCFFGLAGLSKYTAITLVATALLSIAWQRKWHLLRSPRPWLAVMVALVLILPILYWNASYDWISFRYQLGHGMPERGWEWQRFLRAQAGQLLAYSPVVFLFGLAALFGAIKHFSHPGSRYLVALAVPVLLLFGWSSGFEETLPHWTLLGWTALMPLAAKWLLHKWQGRAVRVVTYISLGYSIVLTLVIHSQFAWHWMPFSPYQHPLGDLYGWRQAAQHGVQLRSSEDVPLLVGNWSLASRIAWYARPLPVVVADDRQDQFDLWYGSLRKGEGGLLIVPEYYQEWGDVNGLARFNHCQLVDELTVVQDGEAVHRFNYYRCTGYHG